ncbi:MAG: phosphoadenosine phosphosulfate reductase family protein, partial [Thermoplasmata archaeon]|nr:phosphoadenosine phosphosulfate reductase family protein [Thermoplasmata archaeon]
SLPFTKKHVRIKDEVSFSLRTQRNIYPAWVEDFDPSITTGDNVIFSSAYVRGTASVVGDFDTHHKRVMKIRESAPVSDLERQICGSDLERVVEANIQTLERKEKKALEILGKELRRGDDCCVSYSGGKDSAVVLLLAQQIKPDIDVVFIDTGIEYPETTTHIDELAQICDRLLTIKADSDFFESWKTFGPPSRYNRWCCKTQKFAPMNRLIKDRYGGKLLTVVGSRMAESTSRLLSLSDIGVNAWLPKQTLIHPIREWSSLDVWLYLLWKDFPYNEAYNKGIPRVGCWACPFTPEGTFKLQETTHPKLMKRLDTELKDFAHKAKVDGAQFLMKWKNRKAGEFFERKRPLKGFSPCIAEDLIYQIGEDRRECVRSFSKVFQSKDKPIIDKIIDDKTAVSQIHGEVDISVFRNVVRVSLPPGKSKETMSSDEVGYYRDLFGKVEKMIWRGIHCVGCGSCISSCEHGAIELRGKTAFINGGCIGCLECVTFKCPTTDYTRGSYVA